MNVNKSFNTILLCDFGVYKVCQTEYTHTHTHTIELTTVKRLMELENNEAPVIQTKFCLLITLLLRINVLKKERKKTQICNDFD